MKQLKNEHFNEFL